MNPKGFISLPPGTHFTMILPEKGNKDQLLVCTFCADQQIHIEVSGNPIDTRLVSATRLTPQEMNLVRDEGLVSSL